MPAGLDRARSFMERFVIERANSFRREQFDQDMYTAILDAKRCYRLIATHAQDAELLPDGNVAGAQGNAACVTQAPPAMPQLRPEQINAFRQMPLAQQKSLREMEQRDPGVIQRFFNAMKVGGAGHVRPTRPNKGGNW